MGYDAGYRSGYFGGYLSEAAPPFEREEAVDGRPDVVFELAFENFGQPLTWHDESAYVSGTGGINVNRGRSSELDEFDAGTATVLLRNEDGRYDPANESGPYFGLLRARRQVRIGVKVGTGSLPFTFKRSAVGGDDSIKGFQDARPIYIFRGETGSFNRQWGIEGRSATVTLNAVDHLRRFDQDIPTTRDPITNETIPLTVHGTTGDAVVQLLALIGWPGAEGQEFAPLRNEFCDIDKGTVALLNTHSLPEPGAAVSGTFLGELRKLATTEGGDFFMSREGKVTFREKTSEGILRGVWGDQEGLLPYHDVRGRPADELVINDVTVEQTTGAKTNASDPESIDDFGRESRTWAVFPIGFPQILAEDLLARYSSPRDRIVGFQPLGRTNVAWWRTILPVDFGDRMRFVLNPVYGSLVDVILRTEGVRHVSPRKGEWTVDWSASEVPPYFPNLLPDSMGDFEESVDWVANTGSTLTASKSTDPVQGAGFQAPHGERVLAILPEQDWDGPVGGTCDVDLATIAPEVVLPGRTFQAGGFFYVPGGPAAAATFTVEWLDEDGNVDGSDEASLSRSFNRWTTVSFQTTCPLTGVAARLAVATVDRGRVFADALFLRETE